MGGPGERLMAMDMVGGAPAPRAAPVGGIGREETITVASEAREREGALQDADKIAAPPPPPPPPPGEPAELRSDFSETAFFAPHLLTGADGSAAIEFEVPDSVTAWSFWVHALTADLRYGSAQRETRSVKDLMVRPYLPRFLREGDQAELRVVVNNASEKPLSGEVRLEVISPEDDRDLAADFGLPPGPALRRFTVEPGGGANVTFPLTAPRRVGQAAFKVTARAGDLSDGELRPLPILPARVHLAQSRFAALRGAERRVLEFADLERSDPTRINDQMVVTIDAQLFYSVLRALPYLVNYPYECTEQTLNRFLSTGIVGSLFDQYPAVAKMAAELARRETRFEAWDPRDPNRKMALEETPWLQVSRGGGEEEQELHHLVNVLDPRIVRAQRDAALAKLVEDQLPTGAFPWFPGGPPSDFMTLYILYGFAKAAEFEVEVPRDAVQRGWSYLAARYREEWAKEVGQKDGCCVEFLTFLNYVASAYPDPSWMGDALPVAERRRILDWSFEHWTKHSPYLKGLLSLTLHRMGRPQDAQRVFASVMDSAKTTRDEGTFWLPEDRAWLWYNDTIESHAFALRTLLEIAPQDPRRDGLVQWLFLNKKLNHWKSTRATAEVLYSLVHYLDREKQLGVREAATVQVGGQTTSFAFEPDRYTGRNNQIVIPGERVDASTAKVTVEKETPGILFASATWHFSTEELPAQGSGDLFAVERRYFRRVKRGEETVLEPLAQSTALAPGDEVEVQLSLRSRAQAEYVHLRDPRPAGLEPGRVTSGYRWDLGLAYYEETRDSGANFFIEWLPAGEYTLKYRLRANLAGSFRSGPATLQSMYAPEFTAYSAGHLVRVAGGTPKS
ncbi:MAG TPA: alpha-2-macroglobulin family protein [Thermoanaerobaculia bacterium]|nr:alpha-2-macroglobulin family protein [Thermoanaerobaculia bacterium]